MGSQQLQVASFIISLRKKSRGRGVSNFQEEVCVMMYFPLISSGASSFLHEISYSLEKGYLSGLSISSGNWLADQGSRGIALKGYKAVTGG